MDCCALNRDNSAVKATAKFSGLHNETTAQSFFFINCLETRTRPQRKVNFKWIAALKIKTTAQSRLQQILQTSQRDHSTELFNIYCLENRTRPQRKVNFKWIAALKIETTAQSRLQHNSSDLTTRPQHRTFKINCLENRTRPQKKVKNNNG